MRTFTYDEMDRLASHTGPDGSFVYDYDLNGNRLWHKRNGVTTTYNYDTNKTRLTSRTGGISETRAYDANGNTTRIGSQYFDYNDNDRIWRYRFGTQTVTYKYNAFGERMLKQVGSTATRYVYDGPQLLHERTGSSQRDYIWLEGEVIGFVQGTTLYYVHNDHLGRPWVITNASKQKVWEAETNAFDSAPVLDAIGGFNIGFPGQYYDEESGTWYNYFRTYDPSSGRYLQSDPIGVDGGLNTYIYAAANPLRLTDPFGLQGVPATIPGLPPVPIVTPEQNRAIYEGLDALCDKIGVYDALENLDGLSKGFEVLVKAEAAREWNRSIFGHMYNTKHTKEVIKGLLKHASTHADKIQSSPPEDPNRNGWKKEVRAALDRARELAEKRLKGNTRDDVLRQIDNIARRAGV